MVSGTRSEESAQGCAAGGLPCPSQAPACQRTARVPIGVDVGRKEHGPRHALVEQRAPLRADRTPHERKQRAVERRPERDPRRKGRGAACAHKAVARGRRGCPAAAVDAVQRLAVAQRRHAEARNPVVIGREHRGRLHGLEAREEILHALRHGARRVAEDGVREGALAARGHRARVETQRRVLGPPQEPRARVVHPLRGADVCARHLHDRSAGGQRARAIECPSAHVVELIAHRARRHAPHLPPGCAGGRDPHVNGPTSVVAEAKRV